MMYDQYVSIYGYGLGPRHLLILVAVIIVPFWQLFSKAGYSGWFSLADGAAAHQSDCTLRPRVLRLASAPREAHDHHVTSVSHRKPPPTTVPQPAALQRHAQPHHHPKSVPSSPYNIRELVGGDVILLTSDAP